jgi:two-component system catabolic regulation response regulator CreB/two-component system response regulator ChvI
LKRESLYTAITVGDIIKRKEDDGSNNYHSRHHQYNHYSKEKNYSPPLEIDDGKKTTTTTNNTPYTTKEQEQKPFLYKHKRVLIIDDEPDITLTYKSALEGDYEGDSKRFEVYTYNDPLEALLNFKPNFYDLLLIDINLPYMNGFELYEKLLKMDINIRVCFISAGEVNQEAIREIHPSINIGCFIKKPVTVQDLVKRVKAELE